MVAKKRINMRIPEDLMEFIKKDAEARGSTVTSDYIEYLDAKRKKAEESKNDDKQP